MRSFEEDVRLAVEYHGHLCSGQVIGVKLARYGLKQLGLDPQADRKRLMVFLECDRCPADAIGTVTGCKLGKRTLKYLNYGKVAASFLDLETGRGVRVYRHTRMHPEEGQDMIAFYRDIPDETLFRAQAVDIPLAPGELPGPPVEIITCARCGEQVIDAKHVILDGDALCRACADGAYYHDRGR